MSVEITSYYTARISHHIPHEIEYLLYTNSQYTNRLDFYVCIEGKDYEIVSSSIFDLGWRPATMITGGEIDKYGSIYITKYAPDNHYMVVHHFYTKSGTKTCPPLYLKSPLLGELLYYTPILQRLYL